MVRRRKNYEFIFLVFFSENNIIRKNLLITDYRKNQPSKWAIVGIILAIILAAIAIVTGCVLLRVCRINGKHKSTNS